MITRPSHAYHKSSPSSLKELPTLEPIQEPPCRFSQQNTPTVFGQNQQGPQIDRKEWDGQSAIYSHDVVVFEDQKANQIQGVSEKNDHEVDHTSLAGISSPSSSSSVYSKQPPSSTRPPHHIYSFSKKRQLVYIVSLAGLFSPLSSNIYFPVLDQISSASLRALELKSLNISQSLVSLTITIYMIVQGIAPSFWGPISDVKGRRITFIGTFVVYLLANIGLAFSNNFIMLMVFRGIQAAGSAATISIGAGVIGDITTPRERGGLIGIFGGVRMLGQGVGPVFGGIISQYLGWHAIFWFLFGLGALTLLTILVFLPETLRSIAGNGTTPLTGIHRPLFNLPPEHTPPSQYQPPEPTKKISVSSILGPLKFLLEKDVFVTLFFGSIVYTVWSMVTSSTSNLFQYHIDLSTLEVGLIFLPNGFGCIAGSYITGYMMDHDYIQYENLYRSQHNIPSSEPLNTKSLPDFPVEKARLRNLWWIVLIFVVATALYGHSLSLEIVALPLILQFFIAYTATAVFSLNSALVIDLFPGQAASATAVNNLVRCSVGAGGVAIVDLVVGALGAGNAFLLFAGVTVACCGLVGLEWAKGEKWRKERRERVKSEEVDIEKDGEVEAKN